MSQIYVTLVETGSLVENLYYRPFSRYWWEVPSISDSNTYPQFPIRVGQKTKTCLNGQTNATKAISQTYQKIFQCKTRYSGHVVIGWNDKKIIDILSSTIDFHPFSCQLGEYEIFIYGLDFELQKMFVGDTPDDVWKNSEWSNFNLMKKLYEYHLQRRTSANVKWYNLFIRWNQSECNIIELSSELKELYPPKHQFSDRELGAWLSILCAAGCSDITP
ncbi:hypothetical protein C1646_756417 [Rhizophagus diaphanus]|nr:hypothetical protein C1646_756417 [Rhizophagus diaphanus] [Rhizophagus sp. MUCL 43196]